MKTKRRCLNYSSSQDHPPIKPGEEGAFFLDNQGKGVKDYDFTNKEMNIYDYKLSHD